jgi:hypothetical protein
MRLHLLLPTVKTTAVYLVPIKSDLENTIRSHFVVGRHLQEICVTAEKKKKRNGALRNRERKKTCTYVHIRDVIVPRETGKEASMFRIERCISSKNRSVGLETVRNKEMFTNRPSIVYIFLNIII